MDRSYELIDLISGNLFDAFERESDALDVLIEMSLDRDDEAVRRFALLRDIDGDSSLIAMEDDLVRRVRQEQQKLIPVERARAVESSQIDIAPAQNESWWRFRIPFMRGIVGEVRVSGALLVPSGA